MATLSHQTQSKSLVHDLYAGALSGAITKTCVAPLDRVKVLLQLQVQWERPRGARVCGVSWRVCNATVTLLCVAWTTPGHESRAGQVRVHITNSERGAGCTRFARACPTELINLFCFLLADLSSRWRARVLQGQRGKRCACCARIRPQVCIQRLLQKSRRTGRQQADDGTTDAGEETTKRMAYAITTRKHKCENDTYCVLYLFMHSLARWQGWFNNVSPCLWMSSARG